MGSSAGREPGASLLLQGTGCQLGSAGPALASHVDMERPGLKRGSLLSAFPLISVLFIISATANRVFFLPPNGAVGASKYQNPDAEQILRANHLEGNDGLHFN